MLVDFGQRVLEEGRGWYLLVEWEDPARIPKAEALLWTKVPLRHEGKGIDAG